MSTLIIVRTFCRTLAFTGDYFFEGRIDFECESYGSRDGGSKI